MEVTVSIILPVYNAEGTLRRAIDSILQQSLSSIELIVVSNGCTDKSVQITESYLDSRLVHICLAQKGLVTALNTGIKLARGKYIARMDADDWSYPDRCLLQARYLDEHAGIGLVSGLVNYVGDDSRQTGYKTHVDWINSLCEPKEIYLNRFRDAPVAHPSVMFRKSIPSVFGAYTNQDIPEDFDLWNKWLLAGIKMAKINEIILDWYDHSNRLSRTDDNYLTEKFSYLKAQYLHQWLIKKYPHGDFPILLIWGAGSAVKRKSRHLESFNLKIGHYIDVKVTNGKSIHYSKLSPGIGLILSYVSDRKGKVLIHKFLYSNGFIEGRDFYMME